MGEPQSNMVNGIFSFSLSANSVGLIKLIDEGNFCGNVVVSTGFVVVDGDDKDENDNVCGRRRLIDGEFNSGNDLNFDGEASLLSVVCKFGVGVVDGLLRNVRNFEDEQSKEVFVKNKVFGLVGVIAP